MDFYLGTDVAGLSWGVPVMVSHGRLRERKHLPRATAPWICDSRGFSELSEHGRWTIGARDYAAALLRYSGRPGRLVWASPQDWMCEPDILAKTGKTVTEHQQLTVESVLLLRSLLAGRVHVIPVLQGWRLPDYLAHIDLYAAHGVDLRAEPVVGLGSVCRRQATGEIHGIVSVLESMGLRLHGFGVKTAAIAAVGPLLASADSFAWSYGGRRAKHCTHGLTDHAANCRDCALAWRTRVLARLGHAQPALPMYAAGAA
jgi:hypothetical protein